MKPQYFFFAFLFAAVSYAQNGNGKSEKKPLDIDTAAFDELTIKEWKKFKYFEGQLEHSETNQGSKAQSLKNYTRDSLKILTVKLIAIKILDDKELLLQDIAQNTVYYTNLLKEFQDSDLNPSEYYFLKEKLAVLHQEKLESQLQHSKWLNWSLALVVVILIILLIQFRKADVPKVSTPLSKQELMIRNLIAEGKSNKEIASELFISLSTVKTHITNIYGKLNVSNRQELLQNTTGTST